MTAMADDDKPDIPTPEDPKDEAAEAKAEAESAIDAAVEESGLLDDAEPEEGEQSEEADEPEPAEAKAEDDLDEQDSEEEPAEDAESDGAEEGEEPEAEEPTDDEERLDAAWDALSKRGIPTSVLKHIAASKLIAWGEKVAAEDADRAGRAETDAKSDGAAKKVERDEPAQAAPIDWSEHSKLAAEELGVDQEVADKVFGPLRQAIDRLAAQNKELQELAQSAVSDARAREGQAVIETELRRLERQYPGLAKDEVAARAIVDQASILVAGMRSQGKTIDPKKVFLDAARLVKGAPKRSDLAQLRRNGTVHAAPQKTPRNTAPLSENQYFEQVLDLASSGRADLIPTIQAPPIKRFSDRPKR